MSAIVQMIRELVKAGLSGDVLLAAIDRVEAAQCVVGAGAEPDALQDPAPRRRAGQSREWDHPGVAKAISIAGSQNALGQQTGLNQSVISKLLTFRQKLTGDHAMAIERATSGAVTRSQLRPDLWPEGDAK